MIGDKFGEWKSATIAAVWLVDSSGGVLSRSPRIVMATTMIGFRGFDHLWCCDSYFLIEWFFYTENYVLVHLWRNEWIYWTFPQMGILHERYPNETSIDSRTSKPVNNMVWRVFFFFTNPQIKGFEEKKGGCDRIGVGPRGPGWWKGHILIRLQGFPCKYIHHHPV